MRQDLLDEVVWREIARLLEEPRLIQEELDRGLEAARKADPTRRREEAPRRDLARCRMSIERLLTAYEESLLSIEELRSRMPAPRGPEQARLAEPQAIEDQSKERAVCPRLAESVAGFLARLRSPAQTLDVGESLTRAASSRQGDPRRGRQNPHPPLDPLASKPLGRKIPNPTDAPAKPPPPESYLLRSARPVDFRKGAHGLVALATTLRPRRHGKMHRTGEEVSEALDRVPAAPRVYRTRRAIQNSYQ